MGGTRRKRHARRSDTGPTLIALSLTHTSLAENAGAGTVIGSLLGRTAGSVLSLVDDAGGRFALSGANLVAAAVATDYELASGHAITVRETLAGYAGSPRDTVLWVTVLDAGEAPILPPAGDDIFTVLGDSLMPSRVFASARDPVLDAPVAGTSQYVNHSGQSDYQQLRASTAPLWFPDDGNAYLSPIEAMLRRYQSLTSAWGRGATIVPTARGGTILLNDSSTSDWDPSTPGTQLVNAKAAHNAAYVLVKAAKPYSRMRGVVICLNSNGNSASYTNTDNRNAWLALIDYVRANFDGVDDETVFVLAAPVGSGTSAYRADIAYAATQRPLCYNVSFPTPTASGDNLHPTQGENRTGGTAFADAVHAAPEPATVEDFSIAPVNGALPGTSYDSAAIVPMVGYGVPVTASIAGGAFSVDGGAFSAAPRAVWWGSQLVVRLVSSASPATTTTATLTIGTKSASFNVTTATPAVRSAAPGSIYFESTSGHMRIVPDGLIMETA